MEAFIDPIYALVTDAPTSPGPAGTHQYRGTLQTPWGVMRNAPIGPSAGPVWEAPLFTRPVPAGRIVKGHMLGRDLSHVQWDYQETAHFGPCSGSALGVSVSPLVRMWQQSSADERKWLAQQFAEALK